MFSFDPSFSMYMLLFMLIIAFAIITLFVAFNRLKALDREPTGGDIFLVISMSILVCCIGAVLLTALFAKVGLIW